jgi:hypothetical protein
MKISKEQAAWLIERFDAAFGKNDSELIGIHAKQVRDGAKKIISQCTEKEFPGYRFHATYNAAEYELSIYHEENMPEMIFISAMRGLSDGVESTYVGLKPDEFKEFTQACNKIVGWLDEI